MDRSQRNSALFAAALVVAAAAFVAGCTGGGGEGVVAGATSESCMSCHNGSAYDDYAGPGLENPHPFGGAATIRCTGCHGGTCARTSTG